MLKPFIISVPTAISRSQFKISQQCIPIEMDIDSLHTSNGTSGVGTTDGPSAVIRLLNRGDELSQTFLKSVLIITLSSHPPHTLRSLNSKIPIISLTCLGVGPVVVTWSISESSTIPSLTSKPLNPLNNNTRIYLS